MTLFDTTLNIDITADYMRVIKDNIAAHPRSQQKRIGPSEIGIECDRRILHKLNGDDQPNRGTTPWKPAIGTAMHSQLEEWFNTDNTNEDPMVRWYIEQEVTVGLINGTPITGHSDLFDTYTGTVIDHKLVGTSMLTKYRSHGPSTQYRKQAHLYGAGFTNMGIQVNQVMIAFLPREAELGKAYLWVEKFDPQVAADALARATRLDQLRLALGIDTALALFPACDDMWCDWCKTEQAAKKRAAAPNLFEAPN